MKTLVEFHNVTLGYGRRTLLRRLEFNIGEGEFLGLVGPNRSGKTTLLRALLGTGAGYISPMVRSLFSRALCGALIVLIGGGGTGLPVMDGLLLHHRQAAETAGAHFEVTGGCHVDRCTIRATAQETRFVVALGPVTRIALAPEHHELLPAVTAWYASPPSSQLHSRAPPLFG